VADEKGNEVVFTGARDMFWLERLSRAVTVDMGATAGYCLPPMGGAFVRRVAVPGTVTQAIDLGYAVQDARRRKRNPVQAILDACDGVLLFEGKVVDVDRRLARGSRWDAPRCRVWAETAVPPWPSTCRTRT